jgi:hypothetical protein
LAGTIFAAFSTLSGLLTTASATITGLLTAAFGTINGVLVFSSVGIAGPTTNDKSIDTKIVFVTMEELLNTNNHTIESQYEQRNTQSGEPVILIICTFFVDLEITSICQCYPIIHT